MVSMIASVMSSSVTDISLCTVDREIKIFLSNIDKVQAFTTTTSCASSKKKPKPLWLSKYNFQSLLNIPKTMAFFGPLVNLWEGSNQGEGYLRYAKPKISNIHCKNWQVNAHISLLNEKAFDNVIDSHMNNMMATEYVHAQQKIGQRN